MQNCEIEHVNISVSNVHETAKMLEFLFGWQIRWQGAGQLNGYTIHIGTQTQYIAIWQKHDTDGEPAKFEKGAPLNHIGIKVTNLDEIEAKVRKYGLEPFNFANYNPGRRFYFFDRDNIEYEILSYE